jgi:hypothetical protein
MKIDWERCIQELIAAKREALQADGNESRGDPSCTVSQDTPRQDRFLGLVAEWPQARAAKGLAGPRNAGLAGRLPETSAWGYTMTGGVGPNIQWKAAGQQDCE